MRQRKKKVRMTSEPVSKVSKQGNRAPKTMTTGKGTVVSHTETYGVNVTGSNPFAVFATWALNPGLESYSKGSPLGSWLPQIAQNFDNYEIESLKFKFRTACSTLTTGLAVFGFEPNPEGSVPLTYQEIRNMYSADGSVHSNLVFDISSKVRRKLLVRKGNVVNLPSYDAGKVYFATIGVTDNALVGFVDVEYRIRLTNPQASTTSTVVPIQNQLPCPTQVLQTLFTGTGDINSADNADYLGHAMIATRTSFSLAPLFNVATKTYPAGDITYTGGCKYKWPARTNSNCLQAAVSGRYSFQWSAKIGYEDLKMFATNLFKFDNSLGTWTLATRKVFTDINGTTTADASNVHLTHRGFTGTAVGDPNPGTEVWPIFTFEADCAVGDYITIMMGVLTYNSVSTTTANWRAYDGIGTSSLSIRYLGPLV